MALLSGFDNFPPGKGPVAPAAGEHSAGHRLERAAIINTSPGSGAMRPAQACIQNRIEYSRLGSAADKSSIFHRETAERALRVVGPDAKGAQVAQPSRLYAGQATVYQTPIHLLDR